MTRDRLQGVVDRLCDKAQERARLGEYGFVRAHIEYRPARLAWPYLDAGPFPFVKIIPGRDEAD